MACTALRTETVHHIDVFRGLETIAPVAVLLKDRKLQPAGDISNLTRICAKKSMKTVPTCDVAERARWTGHWFSSL